jgi:hypothetical protein
MPTTANAVETWRAAAGATVISEARSISEWLLPVAAGYAVTLAPVSVANPWPDLTTASVADVDVNAAVSLCWRADAASPQVLAALQVAKHVRLALRRRSASIEPCSRTALAVAS